LSIFSLFVSKKSFDKNKKKYFEQVTDYDLSQVGMSHSGLSTYDRSATATARASEYSRIPSDHPILTVINYFD
jgi:hypothetical protein